jgi:hypothetical protein
MDDSVSVRVLNERPAADVQVRNLRVIRQVARI